MKKIYYLLFLLLPFSSVSQVEDSLFQVLTEQGLNVLVVEPGSDPNGAQSRPCGTFVVAINQCCHVYRVICGGEVKWESQPFCRSAMCITVFKFILSSMVIPTPQNPSFESIPFDLNLIIDRELLTEGEYRELLAKYNHFYFEVEDDILMEDNGFYVLYKKGNYTINQGEMAVKVYFSTY